MLKPFAGKTRRTTLMCFVMIIVGIVALIPSSRVPHAGLFFGDDFEGGLTLENLQYNSGSTSLGGFSFHWPVVYQMTAITSETSYPYGGRSLKADFQGINEGSRYIKHDSVQTLGFSNDIYVRYYIRLAPDYKFAYKQKIFLLEGDGWYFNHQIQDTGANNNNYVTVLSEDSRTAWQQYTGNIYTPGKWFYVEYHFRRNSPGASDGAVERWWRNVTDNGPMQQDISQHGVNLTGGNGNPITTVRLLATYSLDPPDAGGSTSVVYLDSVAVSDSRIGEVGAAGSNPAPAPPTNLRVQ